MNNPPADPPRLTRQEDFLYLLSELEEVMEMGGVEWDPDSAVSAQERLDRLAAIMRRIAAELRNH